MATAPTPEEMARTVLDIYKSFGVRAGEVLQGNNFVGYAAKNNIRNSDLGAGMKYARDQGWIEELPSGGLRLTDAGFAEM